MARPIKGLDTKTTVKIIVIEAIDTMNIYEITAKLIAERAGFKKPSLFHHFSTMDDLFNDSLIFFINNHYFTNRHKEFYKIMGNHKDFSSIYKAPFIAKMNGMLAGSSIFPKTMATLEKYNKG